MSTVFGLAVRSAVALPGLGNGNGNGDGATAPRLDVELASTAALASAWSGSRPEPEQALATLDGVPWTVERGLDGDLRMTYGARATFHLDAGASALRCAPDDAGDAGWQRVLLDSALTTASLARGYEALHAGAVAIGGGTTAIVGATGAGKTTLVAELVRRGHALVADDVLVVSTEPDGGVRAHPAPPLVNLPPAAGPIPGHVLHRFAGEDWILAENAAQAALPLRAIVLLDRTNGGPSRLEAVASPAPVLLAHALDSGRDPLRRARRFALLGDVAAALPVRRLVATPGAAAAELADLIES